MKLFNSKLKGSSVRFVEYDGSISYGYVADVDYEKGITLKYVDDDSDMLCLNKSEADMWAFKGTYKEHFKYNIRSIKLGIYYMGHFDKLFPPYFAISGYIIPTEPTCAFE